MYRHITSRIPSPSSVQTEPEDLSPHPLSASGRSSLQMGPAGSSWPLRTDNKLLLFCDIVLKHVNYPNAFLEPCDDEQESSEETKCNILKNERTSESPLNSVGESARESTRSSTSSTDSVLAELETDEVDKATLESITCWCGKPFAGRPMIECENCFVWYHMSCEQIRRHNVPENFYCSRCKDEEKRRRKKRSAPKEDTPRKGGKKKKVFASSASSTATIASVPILYSPASANSLGTFSVSSPPSFVHEEQNGSGVVDDLSAPHAPLYTSSPKMPPPPPVLSTSMVETTERRKSKSGKGSSSRPRHKKSKSLGSGEGKRKSGGGGANNSSTSTSATNVNPVLNGLSVGASSTGLAHVPTHRKSMPCNGQLGLANNLSAISPNLKEQVYGDNNASTTARMVVSSPVQHQMPVLTPSATVVGLGSVITPNPSSKSINHREDHQKLKSQGLIANASAAPPAIAPYFATNQFESSPHQKSQA